MTENEEVYSNDIIEEEIKVKEEPKVTKSNVSVKATESKVEEKTEVIYLVRLNKYTGKTYITYKGIKIYLSKDIELKASELAKLNPIMSSLKVVRK